MAELGKIEKPEASTFLAKRKLFVIPALPFEEIASQYGLDMAKVERYWGEVKDKINYFVSIYGNISTIYIEGVDEDEKAGREYLEKIEKENNFKKLITGLIDNGGVIKGIEKSGQINKLKLFFEEYSKSFMPEIQEIHKGFYGKDINFEGWREHLINNIKEMQDDMGKTATRILGELPADSSGILIITDGRPVEFPEGIEIFQIRPPAFDEIERILRDKIK